MFHVFLHGLGQKPNDWNLTLDVMQDKTHSLVPSLYSWLKNTEPTYENLFKGLASYCEKFVEPFDLCGLSLGGMLALDYAARYPEKVHSLVLVGTQFLTPKKLLKAQNAMFKLVPKKVFDEMQIEKKDFLSLTKSMMDLDLQDSIGKIKCPTCILIGENDQVNAQASLQLHERIPDSKLVKIPGAFHEVNVEAPEALGQELHKFYQL